MATERILPGQVRYAPETDEVLVVARNGYDGGLAVEFELDWGTNLEPYALGYGTNHAWLAANTVKVGVL